VELFLTESDERAAEIAKELCETNSERQAEEQKIITAASEKIQAEHDFVNDRVIVLAQDNWHHGVIGIVASRITDRFGLPSVLISFEGDTGKGSGRSVKGLNLVEALGECKDLLLKYGGHELAAGLTIERSKLDEFKRRINEYAARVMTEEDLAVAVPVDAVLTGADLTLRQAGELRLLEPYGVANPVPVFEMCGAELTEITPVNNNRHTRFHIRADGVLYSAIFFGSDARRLGLYQGDTVDLIFNLDINDYQNIQSVQLIIRDIKPGEEICAALAHQKKRYAELKQGDKAGCGEDVIPERGDFSDVYHYIKFESGHGNNEISVSNICHFAGDGRINYIKTKFIIDIFSETGIFVSEPAGEDVFKFTLNRLEDKVNLECSCIYRKLKCGRCGKESIRHGEEI
jgi:single-stranded-DNA-specific exonuclease